MLYANLVPSSSNAEFETMPTQPHLEATENLTEKRSCNSFLKSIDVLFALALDLFCRQDTVLFNDTLEYNVQYGKADATKEEVLQVSLNHLKFLFSILSSLKLCIHLDSLFCLSAMFIA